MPIMKNDTGIVDMKKMMIAYMWLLFLFLPLLSIIEALPEFWSEVKRNLENNYEKWKSSYNELINK